MPLIANYPAGFVEQVLLKHGVHVLEAFDDGQFRFGNQPATEPYRGRSIMVHPYRVTPGPRFDIFTIRRIVERLGMVAKLREIESELETYFDKDVQD